MTELSIILDIVGNVPLTGTVQDKGQNGDTITETLSNLQHRHVFKQNFQTIEFDTKEDIDQLNVSEEARVIVTPHIHDHERFLQSRTRHL